MQDEQKPGRYDLILLTQAYNRGEISLEEWMRRTRAWAEAVIARSRPQPKPDRLGKQGATD